jgi:hypothetical protein
VLHAEILTSVNKLKTLRPGNDGYYSINPGGWQSVFPPLQSLSPEDTKSPLYHDIAMELRESSL